MHTQTYVSLMSARSSGCSVWFSGIPCEVYIWNHMWFGLSDDVKDSGAQTLLHSWSNQSRSGYYS
jgi:hypothetical protein